MENLRPREIKSVPLPCLYMCYITWPVFEAIPLSRKAILYPSVPTVTGWGQLKEMTARREGFKIEQGEFPSSSVFKTLCFHCRGMGSIPGRGIKIHVPLGTVKEIE